MDPVNTTVNNNLANNQPVNIQASSSWKKKVIFFGGFGLLLLLILSVVIISSVNKGKENIPTVTPTLKPAAPATEELKKAIEKQQKVDQEYSDWQVQVRKENPLKGLPLAGEKYFIYYNTAKQKFIGKLYPSAQDDIEQLKNIVIQELKAKGNTVDTNSIEWKITQKS